MKLLAAIFLSVVLAGCIPVPVKRNFPDIPPSLTKSCPELQLVPDGTTQFSQFLEIVADNYSQYYQCQALVDTWRTWYQQQKEIFESVK